MRKINRLNARAVATITKPGRHADGGNLYLSISETGARSWVFMFRWHGKQTELGFGSARDVTLARARELAIEARAKLAEGISPRGIRKPKGGDTFGQCADRLIEAMSPGWRNKKSEAAWTMTMSTYCASIRHIPVADITVDNVLAVLKPLWQARPETASRLRGRIERVLDAAKAQGHRAGENPARWRGHLDQLLAKRQLLTRPHHAAMDYADVPAFMVALRARETISARAFEFLILCASRSGEARGARWEEMDLDRGVWTIPAPRMKGGREHRVPLSGRALEIVRDMHEVRTNEFVFPGQRANRPQAVVTFDKMLSRMKIEGATPHGFRSSFRDWAAECTNFSNETCEAALAHAITNRVEAAYRRSDVLEKRRLLMTAWATFCTTAPADKIVQFSGNRATG